MPIPNKPRRPRCERCQRVAAYCLCAHIPALYSRTRVLILQHPAEAKHPLNTARLAALGLQNAELWIGQYFPELDSVIDSVEQASLLFPTKNAGACLSSVARCEGGSSLLIVPDGTWRKARKIIHTNPVLSALPRLSLTQGQPSAYRVRKAPHAAAVSTIEAIVRALTILEPQQDFKPLLRPFSVLVEQQIQAMGEEVYRRNYSRAMQYR